MHFHFFNTASQWSGIRLNMLGPLWSGFVVLASRYHPFSEQTMGSVDAGHGGHVLFADVHYLPIPSMLCECPRSEWSLKPLFEGRRGKVGIDCYIGYIWARPHAY